tara:strand:- start:29064 stop:30425 length:1362 start_codon:yes stop_codon:yes gene_type:complete
MLAFTFKSQGQAGAACLVDTIPIGKKSYHTGKVDMDFATQDPLVFNTYFHDNQTQLTLTEADFLEIIAYLNIEFNQYNIFFKYRGFEFVPQGGSVNIQSNMLNYQIVNNLGSTALSPDYILMSYTAFIDNKFMFAHETGHIFGLLHTNTGTFGFESTFNTPLVCNGDTLLEGWFPSFTSNSENVTRDETSPKYNAPTKGDLIHDTPAAYGVGTGQEMNVCYNTQTIEYLYSAEVIDNEGDPYVNIDVTNFMNTALSFFPHLDHFTPGQGVRMRETILNEQDLLDRTTTICSLYEPYAGGYYFAGPYNTTLHTPLFQPGFDYRFIACGSGTEIYNEPTACETSFSYQSLNLIKQVDKYSLDLEDIYHPNHSAIVIDQLSNTPEVCYNNYNRSPGGGSVIRFNDGVYNTNTTTTLKDSLQINDPYLIDNLDSGLYVINKDFCDGTQEQTAVYKND